jgi:hypothetical protein
VDLLQQKAGKNPQKRGQNPIFYQQIIALCSS